MHKLAAVADHQIGPAYFATPVIVSDAYDREIASFRSPRKLGRALVSGELILLAGDHIHVGYRAGVVS